MIIPDKMFHLCFIIFWMINYANSYPANLTDSVQDGISLKQMEPRDIMIVGIVVPICLLLMAIIIIGFVWNGRNRTIKYEPLDPPDDESDKGGISAGPPSGLINTKETCYMNSMVQALASSSLLINNCCTLIEIYDKEEKFSKLKKLVKLLKDINNPEDYDNCNQRNTDLLQEIIEEVKWNLKSQQDSFNLLSAVINAIARDFNDILKKNDVTMPPKFKLLHTFTESATYNKIQDHLALAVPLCGNFRILPGVLLEELMDAFFKPSDIDDGTYKTQMFFYETVPKILIIHIQANEWDYDNNEYIKPKYYIQYKETMKYKLQLKKNSDGSKFEYLQVTYRLTAIVHHMGDVSGGHYITYRKNGKKWYLTNDEQVEIVDYPGEIVPYIMIYEKYGYDEPVLLEEISGALVSGEERTSGQPTPEQYSPEQSVPGEFAHGESAHEEYTPEEFYHEQLTHGEQSFGEPVLEESFLEQSAPGEFSHGETALGKYTPEEYSPEQLSIREHSFGEPVPVESFPEQSLVGESAPKESYLEKSAPREHSLEESALDDFFSERSALGKDAPGAHDSGEHAPGEHTSGES